MSNNIPVLTAQSPISQANKDGVATPFPTNEFYRFINAVRKAFGVGSPTGLVLTPSPMIYSTKTSGYVVISGGTVSSVDFSVDGTTYFPTGVTAGFIPLQAGNFLKITYSVAPTLTFAPGAA